MQEELDAKSTILEINKNYSDLVKADNINEILEMARKKKDKKQLARRVGYSN